MILTTSGTASATGDVGGSTINATKNVPFNVLQLQIGHVLHPQTRLTMYN